jgi:integrase
MDKFTHTIPAKPDADIAVSALDTSEPDAATSDELLEWGDTRWARAHLDVLAPAIGYFSNPTTVVAAVLDGCRLREEVAEAMAKRKPRALSDYPKIDAFVRDACYLAAPDTAYTAELLITVAGPFALWCVREQGWPLQPDVIFSRLAIDQYSTAVNLDRADGTRRNYRAMLMRISEVVAPEEHPDPLTPLSRKRIASPYTAKEMEKFRLWAIGQTTPLKRYRAMLMLVLCAGAGLRSSEVAVVHRSDVVVDERGILLNVPGTNPRPVSLTRSWESWMISLLEQAPEDLPLWGKPNRNNGSNLLSSFTQYTVGTYPRSDRLRATWIVQQLQAGTPIKELMRALGFEKFENLPRYLEYVAALELDEYRAALRGPVEL